MVRETHMDKIFPDEIFFIIFDYLSTLDLFRGFYNLNSRINSILSDIQISLDTLNDDEIRQYIHPSQVRSLKLSNNNHVISNLSQFLNIRQLIFTIEPTLIELHTIQSRSFPYLTQVCMSNVSDGFSLGYSNMCRIVLSNEFVQLKQLRLPQLQSQDIRQISSWSTTLTHLTVRYCTKYTFYCILEQLSNLKWFTVTFSTSEIGSMSGQHLNLKYFYLNTYDQNEDISSDHMNINELINLSQHLPNIERTKIYMIHWMTLDDAIHRLHQLLSSWKYLKTYDCLIKFPYCRRDDTNIDELISQYILFKDTNASISYEQQSSMTCRITK